MPMLAGGGQMTRSADCSFASAGRGLGGAQGRAGSPPPNQGVVRAGPQPAAGTRAITLISKSNPAIQFTPIAVQVG